MHVLVRFVTALACSTTVLGAQCYFPNGAKVNSDTACNPNALVSACCYDNQACLSNGLCVSDPHDPAKARLHRGTCTDANWKSGNCPRQCLDIDNNGVPVYSCNSTTTDSYCCYDGCDCRANSGSEIFTFAQSPADVYTLTIIGESFTQTHTSSSSSTSTSAAATAAVSTDASTSSASGASDSASASSIASLSATNTASAPISAGVSATSTPSSTPEESNKPNTVALGVGLGVGIPVAALLAVGIFFFLRRRKDQNPYAPTNEMSADEYALDPHAPSTKYAYVAETKAAAPTGTMVSAHELSSDGNDNRVELPAPVHTAGAKESPVELESPDPSSQGRGDGSAWKFA